MAWISSAQFHLLLSIIVYDATTVNWALMAVAWISAEQLNENEIRKRGIFRDSCWAAKKVNKLSSLSHRIDRSKVR